MKKILIFLFLIFTLNAEILETTCLNDITPYIDEETWVLIDIDDTLIDSSLVVGNRPFRSFMKSVLKDQKDASGQKLYDIISLILINKAPLATLESNTASFIKDLQNQDININAFTARGRQEWYTTHVANNDALTVKQLASVDIQFQNPRFLAENDSLFSGVLFASHLAKGEFLRQLIESLENKPSRIIFIDDKMDQVTSVEKALHGSDIKTFSVWYKATEMKDKDYDVYVGLAQLRALFIDNKVISREEAERNLDKSDPKAQLEKIIEESDLKTLLEECFVQFN